ncbi:Leucine carboxyl methyltransferase 1 [Glycine max]|nr:Leucine carboxyl methyltransferase 1 [Glycine max]
MMEDSHCNTAAVQATNDDASASKLSCVKKGYMKDDYIHLFVRRPVSRSPIINRGYFARWAAIRKLLYQFLDGEKKSYEDPPIKKQILSLGAGFDTTYFQLQDEGKAPYLYVEVDFKEVTSKKAALIETCSPLRNKVDVTAVLSRYLRDVQQLHAIITHAGLDPRDLKSVFRTSQQGEELKRGIKWRIGCGDRIKFWEDEWIEGEAALGAKYPRLSLISCQQNQLIQHMGDYKEAGWEWKLAWRRPLFDNEVLMAANFLNDIERQPIQMHRRDGWLWRGDPSGHYTAQSAYKLLREASAEGIHDTAYHELWKLKVPLKYAIFGWRLIRDRLPTKINLHRRQVAVSDTSCPLCKNEVEDAGHLFFHCRKVTPLWWESMSWVSQFHVFPKDPKMHFLQHALTTTSGSRARRWKWWWIAVTWTIWKQRNKIIFSNEDFDSNKVMDDSVFCFGHG